MLQEKSEFLKNLPPEDVSEYKYVDSEVMQKIIAQEKKQHIIFADISESTINELEEQIPGRIDYNKKLHILLLTIPESPHEICAQAFGGIMTDQAMENQVRRQLNSRGATQQETSDRLKEPDLSWGPRFLPPDRSLEWPTVVLEVGYSETRAKLQQDMSFWLNKSDESVLMAISIDIKRPSGDIYICSWERGIPSPADPEPQPLKLQEIKISPTKPASYTGDPLKIQFSKLLLRQPSPPAENDFVFSKEDLLDMAERVWEFMRYKGHM